MHPRAQGMARCRSFLPRRTARLRLTGLYGGLFLVCGTALLAVTYVLAERAIDPANLSGLNRLRMPSGLDSFPPGAKLSKAGQLHLLTVTLGKAIAATDLRQVLIQSPIALAIITVVALALGWAVASRILRPLATITGAARRISASSLNERLNLHGPDDELKALGDTLDDLFTRLGASFEAQRHFVANASHELRTPITRERTMLQVALDDPGTTAETWRSTAREVLASNAEQENLIEALLTLASSEGSLDHREPIDLAAVTSDVLLAHGPEIDRSGLQAQASTKPAVISGDSLLTERLAANLIGNAVRHNLPGGRVEISTQTSHDRAVLMVSNTGPVIRSTEVSHLFQAFQRLNGRGAHHAGGHGLGLAIVRAIATAHGAAIDARANPAGGLTISVTFPPTVGELSSPASAGLAG